MTVSYTHLDVYKRQILASSCDKSIPAHLKAAARMDVPTIFMPGGSMRPGPNMTTSLVAGDISLRQKRKDAITEQEVRDYKLTGCPSVGACTFLGTASTMPVSYTQLQGVIQQKLHTILFQNGEQLVSNCWIHCGARGGRHLHDCHPVSYTHLDVYKRQEMEQ